MLRPYNIVEESEETLTLQYNPACTAWLYGLIGLLAVEIVAETGWLLWIFFAGLAADRRYDTGLAAYFVVVFVPALKTTGEIQKAAVHGEISLEGSRWSLARPLRVTVRKG